jgi:hypothetical protein
MARAARPLGEYVDPDAEELPSAPGDEVVADTDKALLQLLSARNDPYWKEVFSEMLREDLCLFSKEILGLEIGPHLLDWGDLVNRTRRVAINAARDHSKSTFFSYAYPIWRAWSEPGCEVYIFSATLDQAIEFLDIIVYGRANLRGMIDIPELTHLVPTAEDFKRDPRVRLNRQDVRLNNGSRIRALGYGKKTRGRHPKYIVLDDVLNDEDMFSETTRRKNIEYYKSAIVNMATPDGQVINVGTPYHAADLWGWLRKNPAYIFKRYPGILTDPATGEEKALFPWRWDVASLKMKKIEIGSVAFTREILCQPISDDLSIFPSYLFPPLFDMQLKIRPTLTEIRSRRLTTYMGVDIARSASVGADYFVIFVIGVDGHGNHYIIDIRRSKGMPFRKQLDEMKIAAGLYDPALIFIESNAMQQIYTDEMRRTTDLPVKEFVTLATNKYPLDRGIPGLRILLENQKLVIPRGDELSRRITDIWIDEATQFGFIDGKLQGAGEHDDTVMAWWFATEAKKAGGFSFAFGDDDGETANDWGDTGDDADDWQKVLMGDPSEAEGAWVH